MDVYVFKFHGEICFSFIQSGVFAVWLETAFRADLLSKMLFWRKFYAVKHLPQVTFILFGSVLH